MNRINSWREVSFRLPPEFHNDYPNGPWMGPAHSGFAIQLAGASDTLFFEKFPPSKGRPEYRRCVERIDGMKATVVSYNLREDFGDLAFVGPLQAYARIDLPDGASVLVHVSTEDRRIHHQLLAAIRTIRVSDSMLVRPSIR